MQPLLSLDKQIQPLAKTEHENINLNKLAPTHVHITVSLYFYVSFTHHSNGKIRTKPECKIQHLKVLPTVLDDLLHLGNMSFNSIPSQKLTGNAANSFQQIHTFKTCRIFHQWMI